MHGIDESFYVVVAGGDGRVLLTSEPQCSRASARSLLSGLRQSVGDAAAPVYWSVPAGVGFDLRDGDGRVWRSAPFSSPADRDAALAQVSRLAPEPASVPAR